MRKATIVFNELSPFWDDIFIPSKASKYSSDTVPHDNNGWIARDLKSHSGKKAPLSPTYLLELGKLSCQELIFHPTGIYGSFSAPWDSLASSRLAGFPAVPS